MFDERPPIRDGYEYTGRGLEIRLIDPADCPRGHPFRFGQRGREPCAQHRSHAEWTCACGQVIYRHDGAFVTRLPCRR